MSRALIVVDVQKGFADPSWGRRNNPRCEENIAALVERWQADREPIVLVRHDSDEPDSVLAPGRPGNEFQDVVPPEGDLLVVKRVHSAFHGDPDLEAWLRERDIGEVVICGIQTNMCCETTARVADDLGFDTTFVLDATHTFDLPELTAEELTRATAATLAADFGRVVDTASLLAQP